MKYTLIKNSDEIIDESNNKRELIKTANSISERASVIDNSTNGIIYENKRQREENNKYTLKMFMEDYKGFDWKKTVVLTKKSTCTSFILTGMWAVQMDKYKKCPVYHWTHDENVMVITIDDTKGSRG